MCTDSLCRSSIAVSGTPQMRGTGGPLEGCNSVGGWEGVGRREGEGEGRGNREGRGAEERVMDAIKRLI